MDTLTKLTDDQVEAKLEALPEWSLTGDVIQRTYQLKDFIAAIKFVNRIADRAEEVQHHPDILVRYNKVTLSLSTHDAGGITQKDFDFAQDADGMI